ncbi:hypothetical protein IV203_018298 [Nitzschia inconspicua]|uniref:Uncharacterized protein n=1 Tax=Nitzschia inconspicua TaxID=303405 RepID=A0A9K3M167_9STRA|nr:hypothetical protein IV203_018298 [Nitzschia inconspicua]
MRKLLRRALFGLLPVYAYFAALLVTKVPNFRMLENDMRGGMIRNYHNDQTDRQIQKANIKVQQGMHAAVTETTASLPQKENQTYSNDKVLALLTPPGIIGGYRNQCIRFLSLIKYAQINNINKLLLPSLLWSTTYRAANDEMRFFPVPMQSLFDIDHWNSFNKSLPLLVDSVLGESDCWGSFDDPAVRAEIAKISKEEYSRPRTKKDRKKPYIVSPMTKAVLDTSGYLKPIANESFDHFAGKRPSKPRKYNLLPAVEHCQNPLVIGGGKGAGVLWNMWDRMQKSNSEGSENEQLIALAQQALRPHETWRKVADHCVLHNLQYRSSSKKLTERVPVYLALHARVEVDMMVHHCGKQNEKNLTKIFDMVDAFTKEYNKSRRSFDQHLQGIFLAVSRNNMRQPWKDGDVTAMSEHNWKVLNERSPVSGVPKDNKFQEGNDGKPKVFECGEIWVDRWYKSQDALSDDYYGSILPSLLNFYIAVRADVFVGVDKSSWSADVWATRFHLGKGNGNYKYTTDQGIIQLESGGRPPAHFSCKKMDEIFSRTQIALTA